MSDILTAGVDQETGFHTIHLDPEPEFARLVRRELERARTKHPQPIHSVAEGYAVIKEEFDEFWEEVRKQKDARNSGFLIAELVQTAAMCQRVAEDCLDLEPS